jgi:hypothetical protein
LQNGITLTLAANTSKNIKVNNLSLDTTVPTKSYDTSTTYLSDISDSGAVCSINENFTSDLYHKNQNYNGGSINLGGTGYAKGIGVKGNSAILYDLNGNYQTFKAKVGVDNSMSGATNPNPSVIFTVFVDGVCKFDSGTMYKTTAAKDVSIDVTNAQKLCIRMSDNVDDLSNSGNDVGDWADARLVGKAGAGRI